MSTKRTPFWNAWIMVSSSLRAAIRLTTWDESNGLTLAFINELSIKAFTSPESNENGCQVVCTEVETQTVSLSQPGG